MTDKSQGPATMLSTCHTYKYRALSAARLQLFPPAPGSACHPAPVLLHSGSISGKGSPTHTSLPGSPPLNPIPGIAEFQVPLTLVLDLLTFLWNGMCHQPGDFRC